ncbi:DUF3854 domain-containing protein [Anabaena sp. WFMT]|uniref:DUF3854 domain-containing protein n=1 Tax=Anabaena sp. WFMT TaxID=3449730 RepID=UPI003F243D83
MEWGRFKPTQGRIDKNGKIVKYESPPKTPNRVTYFDVPDCLGDKVAKRYNIQPYHSSPAQRLQDQLNPLSFWETPVLFWALVLLLWSNNKQQTEIAETPLSFWEWVVLHPEIPIILCEGEKKAASLLSQGFVAIALPGIWSGRIGKKDFDERLHPDIMPLAQPGRKFIILFDYETKPKTRWSIFQATLRTGKTIEAVGCTCEVALLPGLEKGVDDFIVERSKLIESGQTVKYSQFIEDSRTNTHTQAVKQTLLIEGNQLNNDGQIIECHHVLNQFSPLEDNKITDNCQVIESHGGLSKKLPYQSNGLTNNGQVIESHSKVHPIAPYLNNQSTNNGQVQEHHHVVNQILQVQNTQLIENSQLGKHHQVINQISPVEDNQLTDNDQAIKCHQNSLVVCKGLNDGYNFAKNNEIQGLSICATRQNKFDRLLVDNNKPTNNGQVTEHHEVINQASLIESNQTTENYPGTKCRQEVNQNSQVENNQFTEQHLAVNQNVAVSINQINALLTTIIDDAISLKQYQRSFHTRHRGLSSKYKPDIRVNVKYLSSAEKLPSSGLVVLSSDMGTNKTGRMAQWREANPGVKFLNTGHRVNLLKNLATRLKTDMYSDLSYASLAKAQALSITIDSLHKLNTQMLNYGCVFIDEACQYLTHLLHSKTCKEYRAQILEVLEYIVYNAPLVVIADAHMDDITVEFFQAMRPLGEKPFILKNDWRNGDRLIYWYEGNNSSAIVAQISAALMNKQKIMVASDSKRFIKKLEQSLAIKVQVEEALGQGAGGQNTSAVVKDGHFPTLSLINSTTSEGSSNSSSHISPMNSTSLEIVKDGNSTALSHVNSASSETVNNGNSPTLSHVNLASSEAVNNGNSPTLSHVNSASSETVNNGSSPTLSQVNSTSSATDKDENYQILQINSTSSNHSLTPDTQHHSDFGVNAQSNANAHRNTTPKLRLWSIHSDNSGSEENVAFIKDITNAVKDVDALLTSPSLGTGVDINEYHFDVVYGIFHAKSQTATECAQQLYRYRPHVPIHVWVAPRPPFGYQETNAQKIKERILHTNEATAFLIRIDRETGRRGVEKDWALEAYCQILAARNRSINNLRADLHDLLTEMGNKIISMGGDDDTFALEQMKNAATVLDTAYYSAVTRAKNISATEYRQRQNKDYLKPEEVFECEKFRIQDAYGIEVTESLVEKDAGGKLSRAISAFEAILKEPDGTIFDTNSNRQYPAPPAIVAEKDRQEREHLPLCMDWGNYSAKWLARFNLGLHDILKRLIAGEEVTARDPDLLRMVALAKDYGVYIKTILGFTVPDKCQPMWLLGTLLDQLGLKLVDRKVGPRGKQVKVFSLGQVELDFALKVIAYREHKRDLKQERARQSQDEQRRYQAAMQSLYGVAPPPDPVSTPPPNGIGNPLGEGVNTTADGVDFAACSGDGNDSSLVNDAEQVNFAALRRNGEETSLVNSVERVDFEGLQTDEASTSTRSNRVDFRQFQPDDGDETPLINCVELLRTSFKKGVEAIKSVLRSWSEDRRWGTVLLLEEIAVDDLRSLEQLMPQFYDWLSESVLPMNC